MKAIFTLLAALLFAPHAAAAPKPNIVLIMADDQGWGDTGYNGHPELKFAGNTLLWYRSDRSRLGCNNALPAELDSTVVAMPAHTTTLNRKVSQ